MTDKYILDPDGNPVPEPDLKKWAQWFEKIDRRVAITEIDPVRVSTVFLGLDHNFWRFFNKKEYPDLDPNPILYETIIFWPGHDLDQTGLRYHTREEAIAGHEVMVARVRTALKSLKSRS